METHTESAESTEFSRAVSDVPSEGVTKPPGVIDFLREAPLRTCGYDGLWRRPKDLAGRTGGPAAAPGGRSFAKADEILRSRAGGCVASCYAWCAPSACVQESLRSRQSVISKEAPHRTIGSHEIPARRLRNLLSAAGAPLHRSGTGPVRPCRSRKVSTGYRVCPSAIRQ